MRVCWCIGRAGRHEPKRFHTRSPPSWSGAYFGVGAGAGSFDYDLWGRGTISAKVEETHCSLAINGKCSEEHVEQHQESDFDYSKDIHTSNDDWDIFGTVQVGIDRQIGQHFVIGAFADYDFYKDSGDSFSMPWVQSDIGSLSGTVELDSVWSVGGRIGVLVTPQILLYGMGGYTQANLDANLTFVASHSITEDPETISVSLPDELHGYFVGGGGELKLRDNLSLKVEYRYSDFDNESASDARLGEFDTPTAELDAELHSVRAALVFRSTK